MSAALFNTGDRALDRALELDAEKLRALGQPSLFDGPTFEPALDGERLSGQLERVLAAMRDGHWRTLGELSRLTEAPEASVSSRLRDLRKPKFGGHTVERRRRGPGLFEYRLALAP